MKPHDTPASGIVEHSSGEEVGEVVHTLCVTSKEGILEIQSEWGTGKIALRSGRVVQAQVANLEGEAAFSRMVSASVADLRLLPLETLPTATITRPWEDILIETVRSLQPDQEQDPRVGLQEPETESLLQMARRMKLSERVRFALRCGKEGRTLLIRDGNRAVQLAVIGNPRITEGEIALIACSRTVDEEILRRIAEQREWTKYYPVRLALAGNPKTPLAIAVKMLPTLMPQDVSQLAKSKDISAMIALAARRLMLQRG